MARIRTIKPEFWTDERVGEASVSARLLFIGALNFADDYGGLDRSSKQLKAQVFPYDSVDCEPLVLELIRVGLFIEYEVDERKYLHIKGFSLHQKVENKGKPRIPIYQSSPNSHRELSEDSSETQPVREGNGREGKSADAPTKVLTAGEPAPPKARKPPPRTTFPADLELTAAMRDQATKKFPDCDPAEMFVGFKAHHQGHGKAMASWEAAWTTWLSNAVKFGYPKSSNGGSTRGLERLNFG